MEEIVHTSNKEVDLETFAREHVHPTSGQKMIGHKLEIGDLIQKGDLFTSAHGYWGKYPDMAPVKLVREEPGVIWIRQPQKAE